MSAPIDGADASTSLEETTAWSPWLRPAYRRHPPPISGYNNDMRDYSDYDNYDDNDDYDNASTASPEEHLLPPLRSMSVARILELYRLHREGRIGEVGSSWIEVPLLYEEYEDLEEAVAEEDEGICYYVRKKVRPRYNFETEKMVIHSPRHHYATDFVKDIVHDIHKQLRKIGRSENKAVAEVANAITRRIASRVNDHYPDAVFRYRLPGCGIYQGFPPRIVIEALFPPKRKYLPNLVYDYIVGSSNIELVVGLDIHHWGSKKASVSMWRQGRTRGDDGKEVRTCEQTLKDDYFRSEDGSAVEEGSLTLQLRDFVHPEYVDQIAGLDIPISIPYSKLAQYLDCAERDYALRERQREERGMPTRRRPMM
ncbi:hypothetical protein GP486_005408 [Trichoglossum hirsutum]|uniref:Uncharacterized protein n=1 Tax=Trichoglossum hirsutum TaxID=265104 RepID=A0A9P8L9A5_9PEZI|nr:hypothetical protein GP486_005408 [Trichoglossum hirsutum]